MGNYIHEFKYNPVPPLLASSNKALIFFTRCDLLDEYGPDLNQLWLLKDVRSIIRRQMPDGSWLYPGKSRDARESSGYHQIETFRQVGFLIEKFGMNKEHPCIQNAAEYLFTFQTEKGDFRGIYGTQYATTYSPMISELLVKAGYEKDPRLIHSLDWLMTVRQNDGGWAIPLRTLGIKYMDAICRDEPLEPDRTKPFSHLVTGCVLRALAVHPDFRNRPETHCAGRILAGRLFKRDAYPDRSAIGFWTGFSFPYWFTDLLTSLDSFSRIGFSRDDPLIQPALQWFVDQQSNDGTWKELKLLRGRDKQQYLWITLQISRVFKRFFN